MAERKKRRPIGQELERYCREHWEQRWTIEDMTEWLFGRSTPTLRRTVKTNFCHVRSKIEEDDRVYIIPDEPVTEVIKRSIDAWKIATPDDLTEIVADMQKRKNRLTGAEKGVKRCVTAVVTGSLLPRDKMLELGIDPTETA